MERRCNTLLRVVEADHTVARWKAKEEVWIASDIWNMRELVYLCERLVSGMTWKVDGIALHQQVRARGEHAITRVTLGLERHRNAAGEEKCAQKQDTRSHSPNYDSTKVYFACFGRCVGVFPRKTKVWFLLFLTT